MSESSKALYQNHFSGVAEGLAFAPGRIEFIGNHTDYNGGLVMGAAVTEGITVAVGRRNDRQIEMVSDSGEPVTVALDGLAPREGAASWMNYPVGVTKVMMDLGMVLPVGFNLAVTSTLPAGAGMSSSAAFELATAYALAAVYGFETDRAGFARIGRRAENEFVGMPCGILDQGVSAFGKANSLVCIDCATETYRTRAMPEDTHFWIFNSNKKHALVDSAYADRNRECREALAVLQSQHPEAATLSQIDGRQLEGAREALGELLFRRARHVVGENARVRAVEAALQRNDLAAVGLALNESHKSSRTDFENSIPELDFLVEAVNAQPHVYGARLTGGGFGGAIMAFTDESFGHSQATAVKAAYQARFGLEASVIHTQAGEGARLV